MSQPLTDKALVDALRPLEGWRVVVADEAGGEGAARVELHKRIDFASFEEAMRFLTEATPIVSARDHHPRWENFGRSVSIALTTHDAGDRITERDVALAQALDQLAATFASTRS